MCRDGFANALTGRSASSNMNWLPDEEHFMQEDASSGLDERGLNNLPTEPHEDDISSFC